MLGRKASGLARTGHYHRAPMLRQLDLRGLAGDVRDALPRPKSVGAGPQEAVRGILADVRTGGDDAVRRLTERFDGVTVEELRVPQADLDAALAALPPLLREALEAARASILAFHRTQLRDDARHEREGIVVRELRRPVDRAGLYIPAAQAPLISTVLMTAIPARVAGVAEVVLCSPPNADGGVATGILAAAALAGVDEVYRIGGAQAVAAMAYGTESIRPVDVIVGPGNIYVSVAKRQVAEEGRVGVPSAFAGPSTLRQNRCRLRAIFNAGGAPCGHFLQRVQHVLDADAHGIPVFKISAILDGPADNHAPEVDGHVGALLQPAGRFQAHPIS